VTSTPKAAKRSITLGIGQVAGASSSVDLVLDLGPHHPTSHGMLTLTLAVEGDRIVDADLTVSHLHRGAEKLFEVRDYRQIMLLANRHDWLSAFSNELGVALAVERQLGLEVPERATWIRMAVAELGRIVHHLAFLAPLASTAASGLSARESREDVQRVLERATGGRIHFMASRIGGLRQDVPADWTDDVRRSLVALPHLLDTFRQQFEAPAADDRWRGVGAVSRDDVDAYGLSGLVARAAGADLDLRRDDPYLLYARVAESLRVPTRSTGDALDRLDLLAEETLVARDVVLAVCDALDAVGPGPIDVLLPKVLRVPEGTTYAWTESPGGINGYVLVSRGDKVPWRLKLRSASFNNASILPKLVLGARVDDIAPLLQSMQIVVGDLAK
jgi:NADH-quinone oxidoreductase subunit D